MALSSNNFYVLASCKDTSTEQGRDCVSTARAGEFTQTLNRPIIIGKLYLWPLYFTLCISSSWMPEQKPRTSGQTSITYHWSLLWHFLVVLTSLLSPPFSLNWAKPWVGFLANTGSLSTSLTTVNGSWVWKQKPKWKLMQRISDLFRT